MFSLRGAWIWNIIFASLLFSLFMDMKSTTESIETTIELDTLQTSIIIQNSKSIELVVDELVDHLKEHNNESDQEKTKLNEASLNTDINYVQTKAINYKGARNE